jgi:RNA polymerase sigma factor (sigma-70 family)
LVGQIAAVCLGYANRRKIARIMNTPQQMQEPSAMENARHDPDSHFADDPHSIDFVRRLQDRLTGLKRDCERATPDDDLWNTFIREHAPLFLRLVRQYPWPLEERDDGVQDMWLTIINQLKSFRIDPNRGTLENWMLVVVQHRLLDNERRRKRHSHLRLSQVEADELPGREPDPVDSLERTSVQELVQEALDELRQNINERDYDAFRLRWIDGWRVGEIAARLGMTEGQVWSSHHRTRLKLRPLLERRLGLRSRRT